MKVFLFVLNPSKILVGQGDLLKQIGLLDILLKIKVLLK